MATQVQRRRGSTVNHSTFTGVVGETTVDTDKKTVIVHDGATQGGFPLLREDMSNNLTPSVDRITLAEYAEFDTGYTPTESEPQGALYWNSEERTLSLVTNGQTTEIGQKLEVECRNNTGSTIARGVPVYASGTIGNSGRITVAPMIADGTIDAKYIVGVTDEQILNGEDGKVVKVGKIRKIDTSAYSEGDVLYVSETSAGAWTDTKPEYPDISLPIAFVVTDSAQVGEIFVRVEAIDENAFVAAGDLKDNEITIDAGTLLSGGGSFTLNQGSDETITINHDNVTRLDISSNVSLNFGDQFDTLVGVTTNPTGHVTNTEERTYRLPSPGDGTLTVQGGDALDGSGTFTANQAGNSTVTIDHADTSSQASYSGSGGNVVNGVTLDDYGHVTALSSTDLDSRYVEVAGDTMTGDLTFDTGANIESSDYVAETTGWQITEAGDADFRSIYADALVVQAFTAEVAQALAGEDFLTKSVTLLEEDYTVPSSGTTGELIKVKDLQGISGIAAFEQDDWLRMRVVDAGAGLTVYDVYAKVTNVGAISNGVQEYTVTIDHVDSGGVGQKINAGSVVLDYGQSGDYFIERSVLNRTTAGDYNRVPYDRIVQWTNTGGSGSPRAGDGATFTTISVVGNLGVYDSTYNGEFGFYSSKALLTDDIIVGSLDKTGNYLSFDNTFGLTVVADTAYIETPQMLIDAQSAGDGNKKISLDTTDASTASKDVGSGFYVQSNGNLRIGDASANYIKFDGTDLDIVTDTFNLEAGDLYINSSTSATTPYTPSFQNDILDNYDFSSTVNFTDGIDWDGTDDTNSTISYDSANDRVLFEIGKASSNTQVILEQELDDISSLVGKEVTFSVSITNGDAGGSSYDWSAGELQLNILAKINGSYQDFYRTVVDNTDISGSGGTDVFDVSGKIRSDFEDVKLEIIFPQQDTTTGAPITAHRIYINSVQTKFYNRTQVTLNAKGLTIYNSPDSQINLNEDGFSVEGVYLKTDDISIPNMVEQEYISTGAMRIPDNGYVSFSYTEISGTGRLYVRLSNGDLKYVNLTDQ